MNNNSQIRSLSSPDSMSGCIESLDMIADANLLGVLLRITRRPYWVDPVAEYPDRMSGCIEATELQFEIKTPADPGGSGSIGTPLLQNAEGSQQ